MSVGEMDVPGKPALDILDREVILRLIVANNKLTAVVEACFKELCRVRASGGGTGELSYYLNASRTFGGFVAQVADKFFSTPQNIEV